MAYHIAKIDNRSPRSAVLTNPAPLSDEGWQDFRLIRENHNFIYERRPLINKFTVPLKRGDIIYQRVIDKAFNLYTFAGNWCFWDNGKDAILGASERDKDDDLISFFSNSACDVIIVIDKDGKLVFEKASS